jgi:hypothetical protein
MRALDRTVGRTLLDDQVRTLLEREDVDLEAQLLVAESDPSDRIGVGLALGFLRRTRNRGDFAIGRVPFEGTRAGRIKRERLEPIGSE